MDTPQTVQKLTTTESGDDEDVTPNFTKWNMIDYVIFDTPPTSSLSDPSSQLITTSQQANISKISFEKRYKILTELFININGMLLFFKSYRVPFFHATSVFLYFIP